MVERLDFSFDAHVTAALFGADRVLAFALGDGSLRLLAMGSAEATSVALHDGAVLFAAVDPGGRFVTAGDDGQLILSDKQGDVVARYKGRGWPTALALVPGKGGIAAAFGKQLLLFDNALAPKQEQRAAATLEALAFEPNGRRLGAAHYGGVTLWPVDGKAPPQAFAWKGGHKGLLWSPDRRFLVTTLQEPGLHGWRIADKADMRMTGYPAKVKSMDWAQRGRYLATAGADVVVLWPFNGTDGPMGKAPREVGPRGEALCLRVACHPQAEVIAAGYDDGRVLLHLIGENTPRLAAGPAPAGVSALCWSPDGKRLAMGREDGTAVLLSFP